MSSELPFCPPALLLGLVSPRNLPEKVYKPNPLKSLTVSSTRNPFLSIFPQIWTTQTIRWRAFWTTKVCMPHSLLLSHDKFMLQKLRPPRIALSCNSRKKREKKDPSTNSRVTNRAITFETEVSIYFGFQR